MLNIDSSLIAEMREKPYRDAYVASQIRMTVPLQIRELRKNKGFTQPELAERAGMGQPRISELEKPGERRLTIETLLRIASALDIGLQVRFLPYGELIDWSEGLDIENFNLPTFDEELAEAQLEAPKIASLPKKEVRGIRLVHDMHDMAEAGIAQAPKEQPHSGENFTALAMAANSGVRNETIVHPLG